MINQTFNFVNGNNISACCHQCSNSCGTHNAANTTRDTNVVQHNGGVHPPAQKTDWSSKRKTQSEQQAPPKKRTQPQERSVYRQWTRPPQPNKTKWQTQSHHPSFRKPPEVSESSRPAHSTAECRRNDISRSGNVRPPPPYMDRPSEPEVLLRPRRPPEEPTHSRQYNFTESLKPFKLSRPKVGPWHDDVRTPGDIVRRPTSTDSSSRQQLLLGQSTDPKQLTQPLQIGGLKLLGPPKLSTPARSVLNICRDLITRPNAEWTAVLRNGALYVSRGFVDL